MNPQSILGGFVRLCGVPAATISPWRNQLAFDRNKMFVSGDVLFDYFVNSIYLFDDRIVVNFNYQEGGRPVSLEEVLGSFLDGNGAPKTALHSV